MSEESLESQLEEMFSGIGAFDPELETPPRLQDAGVPAATRTRKPVRRPETGGIKLDGRNNLVVFRLAEYTYALPIEPIVQIVEMVAVTTIPQAIPSLQGVINVRGKAVPVVNLRRHLGLPQPAQAADGHIILLQIGERTVGLIVDRVVTVLDLAGDQIIQTVDIMPEELGELPLIKGLVHTRDGTVLLLDVGRLLLPHQKLALDEVMALAEEEE
jgi:purine-binding chemotaxis protein CheW